MKLINFNSDLAGRAEWMDKGRKKCLILWHRIQDWADIVVQFVSYDWHFHNPGA